MVGQIIGEYRVVEELRNWNRIFTCKAHDPTNERFVCLKGVTEKSTQDRFLLLRFQKELQIVARMLNHVHILPIYSCNVADDAAFIVMPYIATGSLADLIQRGPLQLDEAARILDQISQALDYAHRLDLIHSDLKPSNVLVDPDQNIWVMDFAISRIVGTDDEWISGSGHDKAAYMSPEQCLGHSPTKASDIYSLGVILFEMLSGRRPFIDEKPFDVIMHHVKSSIPRVRDVRPGLPDLVEQVIGKALAKEPADRYGTTGELADAFASSITNSL
jgi:serine/threonine protein kinase